MLNYRETFGYDISWTINVTFTQAVNGIVSCLILKEKKINHTPKIKEAYPEEDNRLILLTIVKSRTGEEIINNKTDNGNIKLLPPDG